LRARDDQLPFQALIDSQYRYALVIPHLRLINAVFNRVTDAGKTFEIGGVKPKKCWIIRRFDYQRIFEIITVFSLLSLQTGSFQNSVASSRRDFFGSRLCA
jgi:hypothetical protein